MEFVDEWSMQEDAGKSIESELFAALLQTKLVRSREESNYHRWWPLTMVMSIEWRPCCHVQLKGIQRGCLRTLTTTGAVCSALWHCSSATYCPLDMFPLVDPFSVFISRPFFSFQPHVNFYLESNNRQIMNSVSGLLNFVWCSKRKLCLFGLTYRVIFLKVLHIRFHRLW